MSFDRVALVYRFLERIVFGGALESARLHWLSAIGQTKHVLIVGEGDGRFLCALLQRDPEVTVDCIDASARMLELARRRLERNAHRTSSRVSFRHEDVRTCNLPSGEYDLIVTHFVLDCFGEGELETVVSKLGAAAARKATWLFSDFCLPAAGFRRLKARAWIKAMYLFFRWAAGLRVNALIDPTPPMRRQGFVLHDEAVTRDGMIISQHWIRSDDPG